MKTINIAVVGALGFGKGLINEVVSNAKEYNCKLSAIVDISPRAKTEYSDLIESGVNYYPSLEEMYSEINVDLLVIASPIQFHSTQACYAMEHGSHVLVEKPAAGCIDDVKKMIEVRNKTGKQALIGYQLCYDDTIRKVKSTILSGELGRIKTMKCIVLWPRSLNYYNRNNWAGKKFDKDGRPIYDSVVNNATAHFFMNLMYLAGEDMNRATTINSITSKLYRANDIETFDTCVVKADLEEKGEFLSIVSHVTLEEYVPRYEIVLENGMITSMNDEWVLESEGKKTVLGVSSHDNHKKIWDMVNLIRDPEYPVKCTIECALEHTKLIESLNKVPIIDFDKDKKIIDNRIYIEGLKEKLIKAYDDYEFPLI